MGGFIKTIDAEGMSGQAGYKQGMSKKEGTKKERKTRELGEWKEKYVRSGPEERIREGRTRL
jgi:hypothetical protein